MLRDHPHTHLPPEVLETERFILINLGKLILDFGTTLQILLLPALLLKYLTTLLIHNELLRICPNFLE